MIYGLARGNKRAIPPQLYDESQHAIDNIHCNIPVVAPLPQEKQLPMLQHRWYLGAV